MELKVNTEERMFGKILGLDRGRVDELTDEFSKAMHGKNKILANELKTAAEVSKTLEEYTFLVFSLGHMRGLDEGAFIAERRN